jgi:hypothetical protein
MLAEIILVSLILCQIIIGVLVFFSFKRWSHRIAEETKTGVLIIEGKNQGSIIAILRHKMRARYGSIFIFAICQLFPYGQFFPLGWSLFESGPIGNESFIFYILLFASFGTGIGPFYFIIEAFWTSPIITTKGIASRRATSKRFFTEWRDIKSIRFSIFYVFNVNTKKGRIVVSSVLLGLEDFAKAVMEYVPREKWTGYGFSPYRVEDKIMAARYGPLH